MKFLNFEVNSQLKNIVDYIVLVEEYDSTNTFKTLPVPRLAFAFNYLEDAIEKSKTNFDKTPVNAIVGFAKKGIVYKPEGKTWVILVGFKPYAKSVLKELNGNFNMIDNCCMEDVYPRVKSLEEQLRNTPDDIKKLTLVENFLLTLIDNNEPNMYVKKALSKIILTNGTTPINDLSQSIGYSQKQLERLFKTHVGISPEQFSKITQFQNSIRLIKSKKLPSADVALTAGYFDQAHFNHTFKAFSGMSVKAYSSTIPSTLNKKMSTVLGKCFTNCSTYFQN